MVARMLRNGQILRDNPRVARTVMRFGNTGRTGIGGRYAWRGRSRSGGPVTA
jgi:hypothetical protein